MARSEAVRPDPRPVAEFEARIRVEAAVRIADEWPDDPEALDAASRLLLRTSRFTTEAADAA
jgi:hypothetical protein